jgi:predicted dehydrogenase
MQQGQYTEIAAIASRDAAKAKAAADELGIPKSYGSYEELLADPDIDAIYNPLPNHLHVPWSARAAEAGKHVLCEKPLALNSKEIHSLIEVRDRTGVKISEAYMVRTHPQWLRAREIVRSGEIGELRSFISAFSYFNRDPSNVRNVAEWGGGAIMDIGCYPITMSRFIFGQEPIRVASFIERDPDFGTDRLSSAMLEYPSGHAIFTCSTQLNPYQIVQILGTKGRIEIEIPWNAPPDLPTRIVVELGAYIFGSERRVEEFPICDQYTIQGDLFARAIIENGPVEMPLEESLRNMAVIESVLSAA